VSAIANERTKLLANALDRASTACFTVGVAAPFAAWITNAGGLRDIVAAATLLLGACGWLLAAFILHLVARAVLGRLKP
jgi:hypothetical protein